MPSSPLEVTFADKTQPKERRRKSTGYDSSAKLAKRQFAAQGAVEQIEVGALKDASVRPIAYLTKKVLNISVKSAEILQSMEVQEEPRLKKKEKLQLKREAFIDSSFSLHRYPLQTMQLITIFRATIHQVPVLQNPKSAVQEEAAGASRWWLGRHTSGYILPRPRP